MPSPLQGLREEPQAGRTQRDVPPKLPCKEIVRQGDQDVEQVRQTLNRVNIQPELNLYLQNEVLGTPLARSWRMKPLENVSQHSGATSGGPDLMY